MSFHDELVAKTARERDGLLSIPIIQSALAGRIARDDYVAFLTQAFHHVRHTVPLLMACGARLPARLEWLRTAVGEYIEEEMGHHEWVLDDIAGCGEDRAAAEASSPSLATELMVSYAYDTIQRGNPVGFFGMVPFIIYGEKKRQMKRVLLGAVSVLLACELYFAFFGSSLRALVLGIVVFFTAFNLLEASLPSLVSKVAPAGGKGTAMGVYSTSQFLGAALGGILGGWLYQQHGLEGVFIGCAALCAIWLAIAVTMREPPYVTSLRLPLDAAALADVGLVERLKATPGVADAVVVVDEAAIYIKVDTQQVDRTSLERLIAAAPAAC